METAVGEDCEPLPPGMCSETFIFCDKCMNSLSDSSGWDQHMHQGVGFSGGWTFAMDHRSSVIMIYISHTSGTALASPFLSSNWTENQCYLGDGGGRVGMDQLFLLPLLRTERVP